jgi:hypothetical protein
VSQLAQFPYSKSEADAGSCLGRRLVGDEWCGGVESRCMAVPAIMGSSE